jgi:hypothetical protein
MDILTGMAFAAGHCVLRGGYAMNIFDVALLLGQTLALAWLACGAIVTILESDEFRDFTFQSPRVSPLELHAPGNRRLASHSRQDIDW